MSQEPFWRDTHSFGYYKSTAESKTWQAVCPTCKAEFVEAHICLFLSEERKRLKEIHELKERLHRLEGKDLELVETTGIVRLEDERD